MNQNSGDGKNPHDGKGPGRQAGKGSGKAGIDPNPESKAETPGRSGSTVADNPDQTRGGSGPGNLDRVRSVVSDRLDETRRAAADTIDRTRGAVTEKIGSASDAVRGKIDETRNAVRGRIDETRNAVRGRIDGTRDSVRGKIDETRDAVTGRIDDAGRRVRERAGAVRDRIAAVDWKAKAIYTGQMISLVLVLLLHGFSTFGNFSADSRVKFACLATSAVAFAISWSLFRGFGPGIAATAAFSLLMIPISTAAVYFGRPGDRGFLLAGWDTGFWASGACLGTLVIMLFWVLTRQMPRQYKYAGAAIIFYCSLGFLSGMANNAPLDLAILGTGFLSSIPFTAQPASVYLNGVLPLFILGVAGLALGAMARGDRRELVVHLATAVFFGLPFVMGIAAMNRYMIPNVSFLISGKPLGSGSVATQYTSTWEENDKSGFDHEIEIRTRTYRPGEDRQDYRMGATVVPSKGPREVTRVKLVVKDAARSADVLNLLAADLVVLDDGVPQEHRLTAELDRSKIGMSASDIVMCLDHSGSMASALDDLKDAATHFVTESNRAFEIKVVAFSSSQIDVSGGFTRDETVLCPGIENISVGGGTNIYDTLQMAYDDLEARTGRGIVILFSDGEDGNRQGLQLVLNRIAGKEVQIFTIGLGSALEGDSGGAKVMKQLAALTGGKFFHARDSSELKKAFSEVLNFISCSYVLEYEKKLPEPPTVTLASPADGAEVSDPFDITARVDGKASRVEIYMDSVPVRTFDENRSGDFEVRGESPDRYSSGPHRVSAKVIDPFGRQVDAAIGIRVVRKLPEVAIVSPGSGAVVWRDGEFTARVTGQHCTRVVFLLDGREIGSFDHGGGDIFEKAFTVDGLAEGMHTLEVRGETLDGGNASGTSGFKVIHPAPTVMVMSPLPGSDVYGVVKVSAMASAGWGEARIVSVGFKGPGLDRTFEGPGPHQEAWDTSDLPEGPADLAISAINDCGGRTEAPLRVNVIKPGFYFTWAGISEGQTLFADTGCSVDVVNEFPDASLEGVEVRIDEETLVNLTGPARDFKIEIFGIPQGKHELTGIARLDNGKTFTGRLTFHTRPPLKRHFFISVKDGAGKYIPGNKLKEIPFDLTEDDQPVADYEIESAYFLPIAFGLVIDVSGSMKQDGKIEKARDAAVAFVKLMKENDRAFLIKFSDEPELVENLTSDTGKLQQDIIYLEAGGGTALFDAVDMAVSRISGVRERPAVVVLTDGVDGNMGGKGAGSRLTLSEVAARSRRDEVMIYTIGLGRELRDSDSMGEKVLKTISGETGGSYFFAPSAAGLEDVFRAIISAVGSQARVSFVPPSGGNDGKWHGISMKPRVQKDLTAIYKHGYFAK